MDLGAAVGRVELVDVEDGEADVAGGGVDGAVDHLQGAPGGGGDAAPDLNVRRFQAFQELLLSNQNIRTHLFTHANEW